MTAVRLVTTTVLAVFIVTELDQGDGAAPDIIMTGQTIVESEAPRDPDLTLADEPLVRIGMLDGPMEYIFGNVTGAIRLEDGSVVIADEQSYNVRRYDASGRHVWTSGRPRKRRRRPGARE